MKIICITALVLLTVFVIALFTIEYVLVRLLVSFVLTLFAVYILRKQMLTKDKIATHNE